MEILVENLTLLFYLGVWKPSEWSPGTFRSLLYSVYTFLIILFSYTFLITEFLDLIFITKNIDEFISNFFTLTAIFSACVKIYIFIRRRDSFEYIIHDLKEYFLDKRNSKEENAIWTRYSYQIRYLTMFYIYVTFVGIGIFTYGRTWKTIKNRELPYRAWVPYDYSRHASYWILAVGQLTTVSILAGVNVGFVLIFAGIIISICAQVNMLKFRFKGHFSSIGLPGYDNAKINTPRIIGDLVDSYHSIKRLYESVHHLFSGIIFFQYGIGSVIFCTSAYHMSQMKVLSFDFFSCVVYIWNVLAELFIVCFCCNELTLEFAKLHGAFYDCKWYLFNDYNKKSIGFMMTNSMKPVYFTCGYVIHLSLDSFTTIIKLSYSIFNLLQNTF